MNFSLGGTIGWWAVTFFLTSLTWKDDLHHATTLIFSRLRSGPGARWKSRVMSFISLLSLFMLTTLHLHTNPISNDPVFCYHDWGYSSKLRIFSKPFSAPFYSATLGYILLTFSSALLLPKWHDRGSLYFNIHSTLQPAVPPRICISINRTYGSPPHCTMNVLDDKISTENCQIRALCLYSDS